MSGIGAKNRGRDRNRAWKTENALWWRGVKFPRDSDEYQELLDQAYLAMARQNEAFCKALIDSGEATLAHTIGKNSKMDTILTRDEFCSRLEKLRRHLNKGHDLHRVTNL